MPKSKQRRPRKGAPQVIPANLLVNPADLADERRQLELRTIAHLLNTWAKAISPLQRSARGERPNPELAGLCVYLAKLANTKGTHDPASFIALLGGLTRQRIDAARDSYNRLALSVGREISERFPQSVTYKAGDGGIFDLTRDTGADPRPEPPMLLTTAGIESQIGRRSNPMTKVNMIRCLTGAAVRSEETGKYDALLKRHGWRVVAGYKGDIDLDTVTDPEALTRLERTTG